MDFASRRVACRVRWLVVLTLASFAAVAGAYTTTASAQTVADPDHWKGTAERQNTVNRFVYTHAPQTIPSSYDPVREAEEILRQRARALPASSPQARAVWSQTQRLTVASRLAPALRSLGTIGLGVGVFELGWKIGTGVNAKFLKIGLPEATNDISSFRWIQLRWTTAHSRSEPGVSWPAEDGWVPWMRQMCCAGIQTDRWFAEPCPFNGFTPPHPFVVLAETSSSQTCQTPGGVIPRTYEYGWAPEDALTPTAPTEPHTNQPYDRHSSTVTPPPQSTVEQTIDTELDKPENELLRDWLNYRLGSPSQTDPTGIGQPNPDIEFPGFVEHWQDHGDEFVTPYDDPVEYWHDAADIVKRGRNGDLTVRSCNRDEDGADLFWDDDKGAIVIVKDGKITTYFVPDDGFAYWERECMR